MPEADVPQTAAAPRSRALPIAVASLLSVIVVLLAVGIALVANHAASERSKLQAQLKSENRTVLALSEKLGAMNQKVAAAQKPATDNTALIASLRKRVTNLDNCLPEAMAVINGMELKGLNGSDPYVGNDVQVSRVCSPVLYGRSTGGD